MSRLLYLVHADPSVVPLYRAALPPDVDVVAFVAPPLPNVEGGGMSSRYQALGQQLKAANGGHVLAGLVKKYPAPKPLSEYESVTMATWSAGYALPREFSALDRAQVEALVLLDSGHTDKDPDGTARDAGVAWAVEWAKAAREGERTLAIGHSDVRTYGTTASTTQFAVEVVRLAGGVSGRFMVRAFDVAKEDNPEHVAALKGWGPAFVADALALDAAPATDRSPTVVTTEPPPLLALADTSDFGAAVLQVALEDMNRAPREKGKNAGAFIREMYLDPLGLPEGSSYCAAAATSWMRRASERTGLPMPIAGSGGAQTLMTQLKAAGRWIPRTRLTPAMILPGMLLVWDRSTAGKPETAWMGHVGCAITGVGERSAGLVEGNSDRLVEPTTHEIYAVVQTERRLDDPKLFGAGWLGSALPAA